jgi:hypothetical protein
MRTVSFTYFKFSYFQVSNNLQASCMFCKPALIEGLSPTQNAGEKKLLQELGKQQEQSYNSNAFRALTRVDLFPVFTLLLGGGGRVRICH